MAKEKMISELPAEAFLIKDKTLKDIDAPFFAWLRENGFKTAWHKGHYGCDWVFVNITHKVYAYGMPGIEIVKPTGNHAISIEDFYQIYGIYGKYRGLPLQTMSLEDLK